MSKLHLLPKDLLIKTGPVDHADWNYSPTLGYISRQRFHLILKLIGSETFKNLLELGYGSGIFAPELNKRTQHLHGLDVHPHADTVSKILAGENISSSLTSQSASGMPYEDNMFDGIVAVSTLSFVDDLDKTCQEISRILSDGAKFYTVIPGKSPILDAGFNLLTGKKANEDFEDKREIIEPTLEKYFNVEKKLTFPKIGTGLICFYTAFKLSPKSISFPVKAKARKAEVISV